MHPNPMATRRSSRRYAGCRHSNLLGRTTISWYQEVFFDGSTIHIITFLSQYFLVKSLLGPLICARFSLVLEVVGSGKLIDASNLIRLSDQPQPNHVGQLVFVSSFHITILPVPLLLPLRSPATTLSSAGKLLAVHMLRSSFANETPIRQLNCTLRCSAVGYAFSMIPVIGPGSRYFGALIYQRSTPHPQNKVRSICAYE